MAQALCVTDPARVYVLAKHLAPALAWGSARGMPAPIDDGNYLPVADKQLQRPGQSCCVLRSRNKQPVEGFLFPRHDVLITASRAWARAANSCRVWSSGGRWGTASRPQLEAAIRR